jgi:hypothetical protein
MILSQEFPASHAPFYKAMPVGNILPKDSLLKNFILEFEKYIQLSFIDIVAETQNPVHNHN